MSITQKMAEALRAMLASDKSNPYEIVGRDVDGHPINAAGVAKVNASALLAQYDALPSAPAGGVPELPSALVLRSLSSQCPPDAPYTVIGYDADNMRDYGRQCYAAGLAAQAPAGEAS